MTKIHGYVLENIVYNICEVNMKFWLSQSNGDYNRDCHGTDDACETAEWELDAGCQDWVVITKEPLTPNQYDAIMDILKKG